MKKTWMTPVSAGVLAAALLVFAGCAAAPAGGAMGADQDDMNLPVKEDTVMVNEQDLHTIYLAGGCFWGIEAYVKKLPGVYDTTVGYANGNTEAPTYQEVCYSNTGHAETVQVVYDTSRITTEQLLDGFFKVVDPTSVNQQGNDRGTQYRSGIYYVDQAD